MNKLTGIRDVDREILSKIPDNELLKVCSINKNTYYNVCNDEFLKRRLSKYPDIEKYKKEDWKVFFSKVTHYINKMKTLGFDYTDGNLENIYTLLNEHKNNMGFLLRNAAQINELSLVIYACNKGVRIIDMELCLTSACYRGHLNIIKYLVEHGVNISVHHNKPLLRACKSGKLEIVKYIVERGVDDSNALRCASIYNRYEIVKYLVEKGIDIHADNDIAVRRASELGHMRIVKYLVENGADIHAKNNYALSLAIKNGHTHIENYIKYCDI